MTDPEEGPGLRVVGGAGGTRARIESLTAAAAHAERAAEHLDDAAAHARRAAALVEESAPWSPVTAAHARAAAAPLLSGWGGLGARADDARVAAVGLRGAAEAYSQADRDATAALRAGFIVLGHGIGEAGPIAVLVVGGLLVRGAVTAGAAVLAARSLRYTPTPIGLLLRVLGSERMRESDGPAGYLGRLLGGPGLLPEGLGAPPGDAVEVVLPVVAATTIGLLPGRVPLERDPVDQAARLLRGGAAAATVLLGTPLPGLVVAPLVAAERSRGSSREPGPPRDVADVLRQVDALGDSGAPGVVGVQRLDHDDGSRSWVVTIPGMQSGDLLDAPAPTDMATNLELMDGWSDDMSEAVVQAMLQSGVGAEEPVLLAGYSQGGMAAMRVAARTSDMFAVSAVVTAGSPVGDMPLADGIQALHLEHTHDYVPALDGMPSPDAANRTTVIRDLAASPPADGSGPASSLLARLVDPIRRSHALPEYIRTAEQVAVLRDRSVQSYAEAVASVLGDGTAEVTEQRYVAVRVPG